MKENIKVRVYRFDTILRIIFTENKVVDRLQRDFLETKKSNEIKNFKKYLFQKKILYPSNGIIFLSASTGSKNLNYVINNICYGLKKFFY